MTERYQQFLRQRYQMIAGYTGIIFIIIGLIILMPLICLFFCPEESSLFWCFSVPGIITCVSGSLLAYLFIPSEPSDLTYSEGTVIVVISWVTAVVLGAVPFWMTESLDFTRALFESTSGWTTTGLSVVDVTRTPRTVLFYRSLLQLTGGAGFAIIMLSTLTGPAGTGLSLAEGRESQLVPNIRRSAAMVLTIYAGYVLTGIIALKLAGMNGFDAVNHAFTAVSTGGFSTRVQSIGYWNTPAVEAVIIGLMLIGSTNFYTAYLLLRLKFDCVYYNSELRLELALFCLFIPLIFLCVTSGGYPEFSKGVRTAVFETVSALSTTGFSTTHHAAWKSVGIFILIILMIIGGGSGSTAGGIKQYRIYVMFRSLVWEFKKRILPDKTVTEPDVRHGDQRRFISDEEIRHNALFVFLYLVFLFGGTLVICSYGYSLQESLFEFASSVGTVGLSVGVTGSRTPIGILWVQIIGMLLGRLEFFAVVVGTMKLVRDFRDIS